MYEEHILDFETKSKLGAKKEEERLLHGRDEAKKQLEKIRDKTLQKLGKDKADIFDGHITLLEDEELFLDIISKLDDEGYTAEYALNEGIEEYATMLS